MSKVISETKMQYYLLQHLQSKHLFFANNIKLFGNTVNNKKWYTHKEESDFISVSTKYLAYEYEIKRDIYDYQRDFDKQRHQKLLDRYEGTNLVEYVLPNYFYYVCPPDVILPKDLPPYAGLLYVHNSGRIEHVVNAKLIHKTYIAKKQKFLSQIVRSLAWRGVKSRLTKKEIAELR